MSKRANECLVCDGADAETPMICSHCVKHHLGVKLETFEKAIGIPGGPQTKGSKCVACAKPDTKAQEFVCPECVILIQLRGDLFVPTARQCARCSRGSDYGAKFCGECAEDIERNGMLHYGMRFCCRKACEGDSHISSCEDDFNLAIQRVQARSGAPSSHDAVNHPSHYTSHPSGVECIQVTEHLNFCVGNAIKYLWRAGSKGSRLEDLRKAKWYIERELSRLEAAKL